jgi:sulfur relay (sulfurtransferase) complex TusBCD TusD component (DsrE family)
LAPFRAQSGYRQFPQATLTYGQCTLGLAQFKAAGLVQVSTCLDAAEARGVSHRGKPTVTSRVIENKKYKKYNL